MNIIIFFALFPCVLLGALVYRKDPHKEPGKGVLRAFAAGMCSVVVTLALQSWVPYGYWERFTFTRAFLCAGLVEETAKFLMFYLMIWRFAEFDEPYDGILYMAYIGLGFAFVENMTYLVRYSGELASTAMGRALFATPGHFLFGVAMGYFMGRARFIRTRSLRRVYMFSGWVAAFLLHGTYDFLLMQQDVIGSDALRGVLTLAFYAFDLVLWRIGLKRMRMLNA